jgi:phosphoribosylamine-glycine ligase
MIDFYESTNHTRQRNQLTISCTCSVPKCVNGAGVSQDDFAALVQYAKDNSLNFLVPGPEAPLVAGITDYFEEHAPSIKVFGPSTAASQLEGSKTFSKDFMKRHNIPTARYENFVDYEAARKHLDAIDYRVALKDIMVSHEFGSAGNSVVIEEYLEGDEISILSLSDGKAILSLPPAQDHKRIGEGDTGPNTGGMGTYAPAPVATAAILTEIEEKVLQPTVRGMAAENLRFCGCLFSGFMITPSGPRVLEYNVRFGDPETQSCLALLNSDLAELMLAACNGELASKKLDIADAHACTVVVAAGGYPGSYAKGTPMNVKQPEQEGMHIFHAGTGLSKDGQLQTSGGRVIAATATGKTLKEAVDRTYEGVKLIQFEGMQFRKDIAHRALK